MLVLHPTSGAHMRDLSQEGCSLEENSLANSSCAELVVINAASQGGNRAVGRHLPFDEAVAFIMSLQVVGYYCCFELFQNDPDSSRWFLQVFCLLDVAAQEES